MRHRITSFRCVEAKVKMSPKLPNDKTCNAVKYRQTLRLPPLGARPSDPAILHHARDVRHLRDDQRAGARRGEGDAAGEGGVEQGRERLRALAGHATNAARSLGLERSHLYKKCKQLGLEMREDGS